MKIALCSSFAPFVKGGHRNIVEWLELHLREAGHQVERIYLPQVDVPDLLFPQMAAYRWVDLAQSADRLICFRPPAFHVPHPHKIVWFIHHVRVFYDLWESEYRHFPDDAKHRAIRDALHCADTAALSEAKKIFANSQIVADRLKKFNGLTSEVLYPPLMFKEKYTQGEFGDEVVYVCRVEHHKRQHLLIEAMQYTKTPVKLRLCGLSSSDVYANELKGLILQFHLESKVFFENRWISELEKRQVLSNCLAAAYIPLDEDSYGYPSLEAFHSGKPVLTTTDSGGVLELVSNGINGYVVTPEALDIADALDSFYLNRALTQSMGKNAIQTISALNISWAHVLDRLLQ